ncbi:MAG TPA: hypothetical protein PKD52_10130 [Clostridiales bacterium]|nr:hypothetical protein [Clostridiales bacterium]
MGILYFLVAITYFNPYYGGDFPYGIILYPVLSLILLIISKIVFKKSFDPSYWLVFFIMSMGFSVIAFGLFILGAYSNAISSALNLGYMEADASMGYLFGSLFLNLGPFIFFICYLINFLVRLVHHKKQKNRVIPEETKMN